MSRSASRVIIELEEITNSCFVAMPFDLDFRSEYDKVIKPAIESAGLKSIRGDEPYVRQSVVEDIWLSIRKSRAIVAELSGRNQNVMYEVGLAHAIGKPIILITRDEDDVPFNLRALRRTFYKVNEPDWGIYLQTDICEKLKAIIDNPDLGRHLNGVSVKELLPDAPTEPVRSEVSAEVKVDLSGVWYGTWLSIRLQLRQEAVLVIPNNHGLAFTASITISYELRDKRTVVQETLIGNIVYDRVTLTGVTYTYVEQGESRKYGLDNFALDVDEDLNLTGKVFTRNGDRAVVFKRG